VLPLEDVVRQVRRQRVHLDLTQAELAKASGTSQSLVAKLERGRLNPSYEVVRRVLDALDRLAVSEEPVASALMSKRLVSAEPSEPLGKALERMKANGHSQMPVVERGQPVGSLSESAVLAAIEAGSGFPDLKKRAVRTVMGPSFPTVEPGTRRRTLVELLRGHDAVLVVKEGKLVGVVTKPDLW